MNKASKDGPKYRVPTCGSEVMKEVPLRKAGRRWAWTPDVLVPIEAGEALARQGGADPSGLAIARTYLSFSPRAARSAASPREYRGHGEQAKRDKEGQGGKVGILGHDGSPWGTTGATPMPGG